MFSRITKIRQQHHGHFDFFSFHSLYAFSRRSQEVSTLVLSHWKHIL